MFLDDKEPMIRDSPNVDLSRFPRCLAPFAAEPVGSHALGITILAVHDIPPFSMDVQSKLARLRWPRP